MSSEKKSAWDSGIQSILCALSERDRLREALQVIADRHIPDHPAAFGGTDGDWAVRQHSTLRLIAKRALAGQSIDDL